MRTTTSDSRARRALPALLTLQAVASLLLSGCTLFTRMQWVHVSACVADKTETVENVLEVKPDMDELSIRLRARCRKGSARFTLVDPNGVTRLRASLDGMGRSAQTADYVPVPGTWTFRRELVGFSGAHSVKLGVSGGEKLTFVVTDVRAAGEAGH